MPYSKPQLVPTLRTSISRWTPIRNNILEPATHVQQVVTRTAMDATIGKVPPLAANSTFTHVFPGPALKCDYANPAQQTLFRNYQSSPRTYWKVAADFSNDTVPSHGDFLLVRDLYV